MEAALSRCFFWVHGGDIRKKIFKPTGAEIAAVGGAQERRQTEKKVRKFEARKGRGLEDGRKAAVRIRSAYRGVIEFHSRRRRSQRFDAVPLTPSVRRRDLSLRR